MKFKMLRAIMSICAVMVLISALAVNCGAQFGTDELHDALPEEAREMLDDGGITPEGGADTVNVSDIFGTITELVKENAGKPLKMCGAVTAVILLASLLSGIGGTAGGAVSRVYPLVTALSCAAIVTVYLSGILDAARSAFGTVTDFMLVYIPVIAGVTAAGGHTASAAVFSSVTLTAIQVLARLTSSVIIPLTSCMIGITAAGSADPDLGLDRLGEGIKKFVVWGLGLIMTVFLGILSVQTVITSSADNAAMKTLKFAVSGFIPIAGGAVTDAYSTVRSSFDVIRCTAGTVGTVALVLIMLPPILEIAVYRLVMWIGAAVGEMFSAEAVTKLLSTLDCGLAIAQSVLVCYSLIFVLCTGILMNCVS